MGLVGRDEAAEPLSEGPMSLEARLGCRDSGAGRGVHSLSTLQQVVGWAGVLFSFLRHEMRQHLLERFCESLTGSASYSLPHWVPVRAVP